MAAFQFNLQGATPTEVEATDKLRFAGGAFGSRILVGAFNASTHVETAGGADKSAANTPVNNKFVSQAGGAGGKSQVDVGAGTVLLDAVIAAEAALEIVFSDAAAVSVEDAVIYAYDGVTPADPPTDLDVRLAEVGATNFSQPLGSAAAMALADQATPATDHSFYVVASVSPDSVGAKTGKLRCELTYY